MRRIDRGKRGHAIVVAMSEEILIRGGLVVDGTAAPAFPADVGIAGDRIVAIAPDLPAARARVIDAAGHVVAPGFIDIKTHSDWTLPLMPRGESKLRQGVTTEVIGHCGYSCAPVLAGKAEALARYLGPSAPWLDFMKPASPNMPPAFRRHRQTG